MKKTKIICSIAMVTGFMLIGCGGGSKEGGSSSSFSNNSSAPNINSLDIRNQTHTIQITGEEKIIKFEVKENIRNAFKVNATDKQSSVEYALTGKDFQAFIIDKYEGTTYFRNPTDYETQSQYNFEIVVSDSVGHQKRQKIRIVVIDEKNEETLQPIKENSPLDELERDYFITTWKTDNPGLSNDNQIIIPTLGDGYNYNVDWGDGTSSKHLTLDGKHTYEKAGIYKVKISGVFPKISFLNNTNNENDAPKIIAINQWGTNEWQSMDWAFIGCRNLNGGEPSDIPNLSKVKSLDGTFMLSSFNQDISQWNTSSIESMLRTFILDSHFNQDISQWDTSNVKDMSLMFAITDEFNQDISQWDTSNVQKMTGMFLGASKFNQNIANWDMSKVSDIRAMFVLTSSFNQDLSNWHISSDTEMSEIFTAADALKTFPYWYNVDVDIKKRDVIFIVSHAESKTCTVTETVDDFNKIINNQDDLPPIFQNIDMSSFITSVKTVPYNCSDYGRELDAINCMELDGQEASLTTCVLGYNHNK